MFFLSLQFNAFLNTIFSSPPTVGLIVAVILDNTLEVEKSKKDRGMPWWVKFRTFRGDNRNEEFYTLPFNLNKFFPPTWRWCRENEESRVDFILDLHIPEFMTNKCYSSFNITNFFFVDHINFGPTEDCKSIWNHAL